MLRRLFGGRSKAESPPRQATHAWELQVGDFVKFGFVAPHGLSQAELQVAAVHALDLGGPQKIRRVITLDGGAEGRYSLWQDERSALAVAHEINRPVVERLFDVDEFARLFDPDQSPNLTLHRRQELPELEGWTTSVYRQEAAEQAYRHARDPALTTIDDQLGADAEGFDHFRLVGDRRRFAVEVAVLDGGRTDVTLIAIGSESIVEEMWSA